MGAGVEARLEVLITWKPPLVLVQGWPCVPRLASTEVVLNLSSRASAKDLADEVDGHWDIHMAPAAAGQEQHCGSR